MEIHINTLYIFLAFLLSPFPRYLSHGRKETPVPCVGKSHPPPAGTCLMHSQALRGSDRRQTTGTLSHPRKNL